MKGIFSKQDSAVTVKKKIIAMISVMSNKLVRMMGLV